MITTTSAAAAALPVRPRMSEGAVGVCGHVGPSLAPVFRGTIAPLPATAQGTTVSSSGFGADNFRGDRTDTAVDNAVGPPAWSPPV